MFTDISHGRGRHQPELSLIVIYTIHVLCLQTSAMAEAAISLSYH